jgi:hypothetical protein
MHTNEIAATNLVSPAPRSEPAITTCDIWNGELTAINTAITTPMLITASVCVNKPIKK